MTDSDTAKNNMNKLKIACIGNMNNNLFVLSRYLNDMGYDANLFYYSKELHHFYPHNDTFNDQHLDTCHDVDFFSTILVDKFYQNTAMKNVLAEYDVIIGCGILPAYMQKLGIKMDIFIPFGTDIFDFPFYTFDFSKVYTSKSIKSFAYYCYRQQLIYRIRKLQRKGVKNAGLIICDEGSEWMELMINKLKLRNRVELSAPIIYCADFNKANISNYYHKSIYYKRFSEIRESCDLLLFHHCRHVWDPNINPLYTKGNDILVRAFASFLKKTKKRSKLILFEYGPDVQLTKNLVTSLGIDDNIEWFPVMPRKEIMVGLSLADIGVGEIKQDWISYGVVNEFMAMALPIICNQTKVENRNLYPVLQAANEFEVEQHLLLYDQNIQKYKEIGIEANKWFVENSINKPLNAIVEYIKQKENGMNKGRISKR